MRRFMSHQMATWRSEEGNSRWTPPSITVTAPLERLREDGRQIVLVGPIEQLGAACRQGYQRALARDIALASSVGAQAGIPQVNLTGWS
jgi:hypothetical protein